MDALCGTEHKAIRRSQRDQQLNINLYFVKEKDNRHLASVDVDMNG